MKDFFLKAAAIIAVAAINIRQKIHTFPAILLIKICPDSISLFRKPDSSPMAVKACSPR